MVCNEGCNCWKCYFERLTLKDVAIATGAAVGTAALIGWGMSSLSSSSYIMNCDGSDNPNLGAGYYGALIRDGRGEGIAAAIGRSERVNITVHELQGLEVGLKLAKSCGITRIIVYTDSENVVDLVEKKYRPKNDVAASVLDRILQMVDQLKDFDIKHINGRANRAADKLVKLAANELAQLCLNTEYVKILPRNFPEPLIKIINEEKENRKSVSS